MKNTNITTTKATKAPKTCAYDCRYPAQPHAKELWQGSPWRAFRLFSR